MNKGYKGSLTIEVAIILPIFVIGMTSILYFSKVVLIHERFQQAITCIGEELSSQAYIYEKIEVINMQQSIYEQAACSSEGLFESISHVEENYATLKGNVYRLPDIKNKISDGLDFNESNTPSNFISSLMLMGEEISILNDMVLGMVRSSYEACENIIDETKAIVENGGMYAVNLGAKESVSALNNAVGNSMVKMRLKNYVTHEEMERLGISDIRFSGSNYCLRNNDILIAISYKIDTPLNIFLPDKISMRQSVRVRGFIGNGNYKDGYIKEGAVEEKKEEEVVYVSMNGSVYHTDRKCYHIKDSISAIPYKMVKNKKKLCAVCAKKNKHLSDNTIVYTTEKSKYFHTEKGCYTVNTSCYAIALEEALAQGLTECKTCAKKKKEK